MSTNCRPTVLPLLALIVAPAILVNACGDGTAARVVPDGGPGGATATLRLNEIMSNDDGTAIDEEGEVGDWIELVNAGTEPVQLADFALSDAHHAPQRLPAQSLAAGATVLFWADQSPEQGDHHLGFKISSSGEHIVLTNDSGAVTVDDVVVGPLALNEAYGRFPDGRGAFARCNYATPARLNGDRCGPPKPPDLPADLMFAPFTWPAEALAPAPLAVTRLGLFPARFMEIQNTSSTAVDLSGYRARLQPFEPGVPLPLLDGGDASATLPWPAGVAAANTLQPGARLLVPVPATAEAPLAGDPEREGVLSIFRLSDGVAVDRVDFMRWPDGAILARALSSVGALGTPFHFCAGGDLNTSPTHPTDPTELPDGCQPLPARSVGDRLHALRTPGDFAGLAEGTTELASQSVKFVVDMDAGDTVHFLGSRRWDLHYRFIRERIYHQMPLDRCDPLQAAEFNDGWLDYSLREYFKVERRFLLGTLVRWGGSGLGTVEFAVGDVITGEQMRRAFFAVTGRVPDPQRWAVRPQAADQVARIRDVEGTLPIVDPSAPFRNQTFQPLVAAAGYGVLQFVAGTDLATATLGPDVIVITDEVPNDIPLVGGLITEAFQTPLAHVAVLSKNRGTPNMALLGARSDPRLAPYLNKLVRFEVSGAGFTIAETTPAEATMFWDSLRPKGPRLAPRLDTSVRSLVDLTTTGTLESLPVVGAKAAQIGELFRLSLQGVACPAGLPLPRAAFAVPVVHYLEHFQRSGAAALFAARSADPAFAADPMQARGSPGRDPRRHHHHACGTRTAGHRASGDRGALRDGPGPPALKQQYRGSAGVHRSRAVHLRQRRGRRPGPRPGRRSGTAHRLGQPVATTRLRRTGASAGGSHHGGHGSAGRAGVHQ